MTNVTKEYPDFFKVFLLEKHYERMQIPDAFVNLMCLKTRLMKDVTLRDHRGREWHVKTRSVGAKLYFADGWKRFREQNCLEESDFIVFTHVENNVFKFKILELASMCEKIKVMEVDNNVMEEEDDGDANGDDDDDDDDYDDDNDDDDDDVMMIEHDDDDDPEEEIEAVKGNIRNQPQHLRTCKARDIESSSKHSKHEDDEFDAEIYVQEGNPYFVVKQSHNRPNEIVTYYIHYSLFFHFFIIYMHCFLFNMGALLDNLFQKTQLRTFAFALQNISHLYVAIGVQKRDIEAYHFVLPQISTEHIKKRGEIRRWKDGRVLVQGWEGFCRKSKIKENDRCICELVLREDKTIEMLRVHVIRRK
uniref:B3 domain-containing protein REM20-like n=1 Tax=Cicer arietinum TaxID=3827 RepID=A0A3Q7XPX9_CICAR|nr:B3 domain-containing protein REM20-like [Cicer arietinum]